MSTAPQFPDPNQQPPWGSPPPQGGQAGQPAGHTPQPQSYGYAQPGAGQPNTGDPQHGISAPTNPAMYPPHPGAQAPYPQGNPHYGHGPQPPKKKTGLWVAGIAAAAIASAGMTFAAVQLTGDDSSGTKTKTVVVKKADKAPADAAATTDPAATPSATPSASTTPDPSSATPATTTLPAVTWKSGKNVAYVSGGLGGAESDYTDLSNDGASQGEDFGIGADGALRSDAMNGIAQSSFSASRGYETTGGVFKEIPAQIGFKYKFYLDDYQVRSEAIKNLPAGEELNDSTFPESNYYRWLYVEVVPATSGSGKYGFKYSDQP